MPWDPAEDAPTPSRPLPPRAPPLRARRHDDAPRCRRGARPEGGDKDALPQGRHRGGAPPLRKGGGALGDPLAPSRAPLCGALGRGERRSRCFAPRAGPRGRRDARAPDAGRTSLLRGGGAPPWRRARRRARLPPRAASARGASGSQALERHRRRAGPPAPHRLRRGDGGKALCTHGSGHLWLHAARAVRGAGAA